MYFIARDNDDDGSASLPRLLQKTDRFLAAHPDTLHVKSV